MKQPTLEDLFSDINRLKIIKFFIRNSSSQFSLAEIASVLNIGKNIILREASKLLNTGFLRSKKIGKERLFFINNRFYIVEELSNLVKKSSSMSDEEIISAVKKIGKIKLVFISGIFINNDDSRADIIIVGKINPKKLDKFVKEIESKIGKELIFAVMTTEEFKYRYQMFDRFIRDFLEMPHKTIIGRLNA